MKKEFVNAQATVNEETFNRDLMKDLISEIVKSAPGYRVDDVAEELTNEFCEMYCKMVFPINVFNPMKIGAIIEENAEHSKNDRELQESMLAHMTNLASFFHKELYADGEEVGSRASMLSLASTLLVLNYGIDMKLGNMIDSQAHVALSRATIAIRSECCRFLKSAEFISILKSNNVAFFQDGNDIIIQMLSGSFNVNTGRYEYGHILLADGICLDPSMKGWDMIIFLMYT